MDLHPNATALRALGGVRSGITKRSWPLWKRIAMPTRMAIARHDPTNAALSIPTEDWLRAVKFIFNVGFKAGAGRRKL